MATAMFLSSSGTWVSGRPFILILRLRLLFSRSSISTRALSIWSLCFAIWSVRLFVLVITSECEFSSSSTLLPIWRISVLITLSSQRIAWMACARALFRNSLDILAFNEELCSVSLSLSASDSVGLSPSFD
ncbi:hypothetical protein GDO78_013852 [Eleutherodactylus coqui]|uniref:Uncharacterized protein n=1 Tax=Eleutherodactylus coqui TaxID=57060 RepID=A0A8J6EFA5_ELECQ|nr:hypothetical protein GDO78_013852 [Eleutherodactylus coqui]